MAFRNSKIVLAGGLLALGALLSPVAARADELVYQKLLPRTAWIIQPRDKDSVNLGSGVLVDAQRRWVLTNHHVVEKGAQVLVVFPVLTNGKVVAEKSYYTANLIKVAIPGKVIARREKADLAVIELDRLPPNVQAVPLAAASPRPGQTVHLIGNPGGPEALWIYSHGTVRQVYSARAKLNSFVRDCQIILCTLPTNVGDSGGPMVNDRGELVGLNSSLFNQKNLLTEGVDITEIRTLLAQAGGGKAPPQPTVPVSRPSVVASLLGTWKAATVNDKGAQMQVTLTVQKERMEWVSRGANGQQTKTIAAPATYTDGQLKVLNNGQWQNFGTITWVNPNEFTFQVRQLTLQFRKTN